MFQLKCLIGVYNAVFYCLCFILGVARNYLLCLIRTEHGGCLCQGKRKVGRPISTKKAMHLVFRSDNAVKELSFLNHEGLVRKLLKENAKRFYVEVYETSVNNNHLHFLVKAKDREGFKNFLRAFTGILAKKMLKGKPSLSRFWSETIFSRIVEWGKAFKTAQNYVLQNTLEARGLIAYKPRAPKRRQAVAPAPDK